MGMGGPKKGGIKKAAMHRVGPRRTLAARHPDCRSLTVTLQAVVKDATGPQRLVASVKVAQAAQGAQVRGACGFVGGGGVGQQADWHGQAACDARAAGAA